MRAGMAKLMPRVEEAVRAKFQASGVPSGRFTGSIHSTVLAGGGGVVASRDTRPLKTWLETGRRRGVKTKRRGAYGWRAGKKVAKDLNKQGFFADEIARRLNG